MQVAGDTFGPHVENVEHARDGLGVMTRRRRVVEAADIGRDEGFPPARHRHAGLEMRAERERVGAVARKWDRLGNEAARAAQKGGRAGDQGHHAIVRSGDDLAVEAHDQIGDAGELLAGLGVVDDQRLAAHIGARCDERVIERRLAPGGACRLSGQGVEDEVMSWRIGEHRADSREARRDRSRQRLGLLDDDDRARRGAE